MKIWKKFFKNHGILGMNARNLLYIRPFNPKKAIKMADDKIKTKQFLSARDIPVPRLFSVIKNAKQLENFDFSSLPNRFVLKPNKGFGGEGIIPIIKTENAGDVSGVIYHTAGGRKLTINDIHEHISDILDGRFSISNVSDYAFFEQLIVSDDTVGQFSSGGLPDIRVVVHNLIPVMAMLRLPTKESQGKANLHLGACGVGIDIAKGVATHIVYHDRIIEELPDGLGEIKNLKIPYWDQILHIASKVQLLTNLGYMAIDLCLDKNSGPVLLEINARAGLAVQIANLAPLRKRLERIQGIKVTTPQKAVRVAKDLFGNVIEKEIAQISGREIIGVQEYANLYMDSGNYRLRAKIDPTIMVSEIDRQFVEKNSVFDLEQYPEKKKIKFSLKNKRLQTIVKIEDLEDGFDLVLGSRDLKSFLVDPSLSVNFEATSGEDLEKKSNQLKINSSKIVVPGHFKVDYQKLDRNLIEIDKQIKLLYHLKPINLAEEKEKFFKKAANPQFEYPQLKFDPAELLEKLNNLKFDDSDLGRIFRAKKEEVENKVNLLDSIGEDDFTKYSIKLFSSPTLKDFEKAEENYKKIQEKKLVPDLKLNNSTIDAVNYFEKVLKTYGLESWKIKLKDGMVARCLAGKLNRLFVKAGACFSDLDLKSLTVHEIETHILTAVNGSHQKFQIFNRGLANYLETQEGLAVYNEEIQIGKKYEENKKPMAKLMAMYKSLNSSFLEVYEFLLDLGVQPKNAFEYLVRLKRGLVDTSQPGAFTKDYVYFSGYYQVKEFVEGGGDLKDLYYGKYNLRDLELVKNFQNIKNPLILPKWIS